MKVSISLTAGAKSFSINRIPSTIFSSSPAACTAFTLKANRCIALSASTSNA